MKEITICLKNMCFRQLYVTQLSFVGNGILHLKKYEKFSRKMYKNVISNVYVVV